MKMLKIIAAASIAALFVSCAPTSKPLLSFSYASVTETKIDSKAAKSMGEVQSECIAIGENGMGLMESAVANALAKAPGSKFLKDANFVTFGGTCVQVSGTAMQ